MENKLKQLFDFQKFVRNAPLAEVIDEVEGHYSNALSDEDLELVNAAGDTDGLRLKKVKVTGNEDD